MRIDFYNLKFLTLLTEDREKFTVIFGGCSKHVSIAEMLNLKVVAAGFISMSLDELQTRGYSATLNICSGQSYDIKDHSLNGLYLPNLRVSILTDNIELLLEEISNHVKIPFEVNLDYENAEAKVKSEQANLNLIASSLINI